jgi:phosphoribosyl-dephospho-CoA transferase
MLDEETKNEILKSILEESMHVKYGVITLEFNIHASNIMGWDVVEIRKKKHLTRNKVK